MDRLYFMGQKKYGDAVLTEGRACTRVLQCSNRDPWLKKKWVIFEWEKMDNVFLAYMRASSMFF